MWPMSEFEGWRDRLIQGLRPLARSLASVLAAPCKRGLPPDRHVEIVSELLHPAYCQFCGSAVPSAALGRPASRPRLPLKPWAEE